MHPFEEKISKFMDACGLPEPSAGRVIVGLSGGADSVGLLACLSALGYRCIAAHCNFGLRGAESDRDRAHSLAIALRLGCEWESVEFPARDYCSEHHLGLEEGCRRLRYEWFRSLKVRKGIRFIAVAHNRQDQTETFFLNLLRSAGPAGLKGMLPLSGDVMRPLLCAGRCEIEEYLAHRGLTFVTDSSNATDLFLRNRLRHNVIPALREAGAPVDVDRAVTASMGHLAEDYALMMELVERASQPYILAADTYNVAAITAAEPYPAAFLFKLLAPKGFSRDVTDAVLSNPSASGRRFKDGRGRRWLLDRGILRPYQQCAHPEITAADLRRLPLVVEEINRRDFHPVPVGDTLYLDADALPDCTKWELRPWRTGDRLRPFGMNGSRLVSDILSDAKVPLDSKKSVRVLILNGDLLWVIGYRASAHYPVTHTTQRILKITL